MIHPAEICIARDRSISEALKLLENTGRGILLTCGDGGSIERTVTDGDLRRMLIDGAQLSDSLEKLPPKESISVHKSKGARYCLELMKKHSVEHLLVIDDAGDVTSVMEWLDIGEPILLSPPHLGEMEREFVAEAIDSNWIAPLGPQVDAFERELAALVGVSHAAALASGTAALHLALRVLGVGAGDAVICSSFTFVASVNPILYQGATPVLIDSDPESWNMSVPALSNALEKASREGQLPKAAIIVNLYGQSADMDALVGLCKRYGVAVIEDAAESLGAHYKGKHSGTLGDLGIYSFNGNKIITTSGGGMLVSDSKELIAKARHLSTQAKDAAPWYLHSEVGFNYRMSNILAGVGRGQLKVLRDRVRARRQVFDWYQEELRNFPAVDWMPEPAWSEGTRWLTAALIDSSHTSCTAKMLIEHLNDELIEARHVWKPMHQQPLLSGYDYFMHGAGSVCDDLFNRGICFPSGSNMTREDVARVGAEVRAFLA